LRDERIDGGRRLLKVLIQFHRMMIDELELWNSGVTNMTTSKDLSYAVYFYNCKTSGLRGNMEHKNLDASQFSFVSCAQCVGINMLISLF